MRWKLLVATSLVAALVGAGGSFGLSYALLRFSRQPRAWLALLMWAELIPLAAAFSAGYFIYRHTARRRKLQAFSAIALSFSLAQTFVYLVLPFLPALKRLY